MLGIIAFLVAFSVTPFVFRLLMKLNVGKQIRSHESAPIFAKLHEHKKGILTMAGIIVWGTILGLAFLFSILANTFHGFWDYVNFIDRKETYLPIAAMALGAFFGLLDDLLGVFKIGPAGGGIKVRHKLIVYSLLAVVGALWFYFRLDWDVLMIPFFGPVSIGWFYIPFFMFIIIASAFSTNETDGLDGLAGGVMLFAFIALTVVSFVLCRYELATFGAVTIGALLAFLWFNIYPAKFIMGDTGSIALGVTMGVIAMLTNTALLLPLFAPILVIESVSVIIQMISKKTRGKKVFLSAPIHHHFQALGWPEAQVTMRFWIISAIGTAIGLVLFFLSQYLISASFCGIS
jgi:phospho-N-acetylmuramoyl-pentapeptide-transferase